MATSEEIGLILKSIKQNAPFQFFKRIDQTSAGISAVLNYLYENGPVTAGDISDNLNVSTARVAVLLKKMVSKELIEKSSDKKDARVTVVRLSDYGREMIENIRDDMCDQIGKVIDSVGMMRLLEFIEISAEIDAIAKPPEIKF